MENTILFNNYDDFTKQDKIVSSLVDTNSELVPELFKGFKYPISSWPIIIDQTKKEDLQKVCTAIPRLLYDIPELYFNNDLEKIAAFYFEGDTTIGQFSMLCHEKKEEVSCRLDLIYTKDGFKVLEVNMGSSLGGMEFQNFEPVIRKSHAVLAAENEKFTYRKTQSLYVKFITEKIEQYVSATDRELGIFFINNTPEQYEAKQIVIDFFNELFTKELQKRTKIGKAYMGEVSELQYLNDGLFYKGKKIHAILALDFDSSELSLEVFRALLADQVYFPDHLGTAFMRDKRNLALLRKLAIANKFNTEDKELILTYIPWTEILTNETTEYQGITDTIPNLLRNKKDHFVIKIADGLQGENVYVGKYYTQDAWNEIIEMAIKENKYLVQEFSESVHLSAPNKENAWEAHRLVWGAFGFGNAYGGSWVRMSSNESDGGVINSAKGAVEAIVYETI